MLGGPKKRLLKPIQRDAERKLEGPYAGKFGRELIVRAQRLQLFRDLIPVNESVLNSRRFRRFQLRPV